MDKVAQINRYHVEQFSQWIAKLKAADEADVSVLDNSMIVYGAGLADGNAHTHHDLPALIAGRGGNFVKTGRRVAYGKETPMCNLTLEADSGRGRRSQSLHVRHTTVNPSVSAAFVSSPSAPMKQRPRVLCPHQVSAAASCRASAARSV